MYSIAHDHSLSSSNPGVLFAESQFICWLDPASVLAGSLASHSHCTRFLRLTKYGQQIFCSVDSLTFPLKLVVLVLNFSPPLVWNVFGLFDLLPLLSSLQ